MDECKPPAVNSSKSAAMNVGTSPSSTKQGASVAKTPHNVAAAARTELRSSDSPFRISGSSRWCAKQEGH